MKLVMCVFLLLAACDADEGPEPTKFECRSSNVDISFWPAGHAAIPSINAPEAREPHIEVAAGGREVFYFDATGRFIGGVAACDESSAAMPDDLILDGSEQRSATRLSCRLGTDGVIWRSQPGAEPAAIVVTAGDRSIVQVSLTLDGPTMTYRPDSCILHPPPS